MAPDVCGQFVGRKIVVVDAGAVGNSCRGGAWRIKSSSMRSNMTLDAPSSCSLSVPFSSHVPSAQSTRIVRSGDLTTGGTTNGGYPWMTAPCASVTITAPFGSLTYVRRIDIGSSLAMSRARIT